MTWERDLLPRIEFLARVAGKERQHLITTDQRLFREPFSMQRVEQLDTDPDLAERVEAFVGRFGRLQDTLADKLLPMLLRALGETPGAALDNLDRAERLGWLDSVEDWLTIRKLRNQMVHEYVEDPTVLSTALQSAHEFVLVTVADNLLGEIAKRGWRT